MKKFRFKLTLTWVDGQTQESYHPSQASAAMHAKLSWDDYAEHLGEPHLVESRIQLVP